MLHESEKKEINKDATRVPFNFFAKKTFHNVPHIYLTVQ